MRDIAQRAADTLMADGTEVFDVPVTCRIDTQEERGYYRHGGILPQVYREFVARIGAEG